MPPSEDMRRFYRRVAEFILLNGKRSKVPVREIFPPEIIGGLAWRVEVGRDLPRGNAIRFLREATDILSDGRSNSE